MKAPAATVQRLRVPAAAAAPARRFVERWLGALQMRRYGLPTDAIVVVRRARAALAAIAGDSANDPLAAPLRSAARPATVDFVGAAVEAVWFADEAELLACMARDLLAGTLGGSWWWAMVLGRGAGPDAAFRRWLGSPRAVPRALALLAPMADSRAWLQSLGAARRLALVQALAHEYPVGAAAVEAIAARELVRPRQADVLPPAAGSSTPASIPVPGADAAEAIERLCGVLRVDPVHAAGVDFVRSLGSAPLPLVAVASTTAGAMSTAAARSPAVDIGAPARRPCARPAVAVGPSAPAVLREPAPAATPAMPRPAAPQPERGPGEAAAAAAAAADAVAARAPSPPRLPSPPSPTPRRSTIAEVRTETAFATAFGGLFFVLNVALSLGLYGDFTRPLHAGLPVSPWQFLHRCARAWWGRRFSTEAIAPWLLSQSSSATPLPPLPHRWLAGDEPLRAFAADRRPWHALLGPDALHLVHPAGFVAARESGAGEAELPALLAATGAAPHPVLHRSAPSPRRSRRPSNLLDPWPPLLAARLALALAMPPRPALALLALPARLRFAPGRLDLHFALVALPLALRLAGLDRDPGWIPAAGCDVRFHFE